jgi:GTPase SAR1 family protein
MQNKKTAKKSPEKNIERIVDETLTILEKIGEIPQMSDSSFDDFQKTCMRIPEQMSQGCLKIAVVGVIKSGKSTFVNSLIGKELVKRGAGVITSITTRIRKGAKNQAGLHFKSWDDVNAQLRNALILFPKSELPDCMPGDMPNYMSDIIGSFDIRRKNDRQYLKKVYQSLMDTFPVTQEGISPQALLIGHALKGFDSCKDLVQADQSVINFKGKEFDKHKTFTSDANKAFYIKDACLDVYGKTIDKNVELADCQGADSTDPAQFAHILDYLESSNLIIYCISSRIGLRQSDIVFLKRIKNLGLLDNILFINNCDLTEHENLDDLIKIEDSIHDSLQFLKIQPKIYSFSSLYNLFYKLESKLSKKNLNRLKFWREEKKMIEYCDLKTHEFNLIFNDSIEKNKDILLNSNHLHRIGIIISHLEKHTDIFLDLLSSDKSKEVKALETIDKMNQNASRLKSIVANSIAGAVSGLNDEIELNLKDVFAYDNLSILSDTRDFIKKLPIDVEKYRSVTDKSGFNQILYLIFQDFKQKFALCCIENIKPRIKQMVKVQENRILSYFQSLFDSYQIDLLKSDQFSQFEDALSLEQYQKDFIESIDIKNIKQILGLQIPEIIFEAKYTPRIKANVLTLFGLETLSEFLSAFFDKKSVSFSPGLKKAVVKIKNENQRFLKRQFAQYHLTLQTNYFLPLIEASTRDFEEKIDERFNRYNSFKNEMSHLFSLKYSEKKDQKSKIFVIKQQIQRVAEDIKSCS